MTTEGSSSRLGLPIAEARLFEPVRILLGRMLPTDALTTILPEFRTEHGVVDLGGFVVDAATLARRIAAGPLLRGQLAPEIGVAVMKGARNRASVASRLRLGDRSVARGIATLRAAGMLLDESGKLSATEVLRSPALQLAIAVELKVSDWRAAVQQGVQHALFADQSYVAMDLSYFRRYGKKAQMLSDRGIGLIGVDVASSSAVLLERAKGGGHIDAKHRLMASEEVLRRILDAPIESR